MRKIVLAMLLVALSCTACGYDDTTTYKELTMKEWISPDGVHYWFKDGGYGMSYMAPRYDNSGNLIIDYR